MFSWKFTIHPTFCSLVLLLLGCGTQPKATYFESKHEPHSHERDKMMLKDFGDYHAGLTAHLSKDEGNELDVLFETADDNPKPVPLPLSQLTAEARRPGDETKHPLDFEPAPKDERAGDPDGKCSHFTAKTPWMKRDDHLTVTLTVVVDGKKLSVEWNDFVPLKFAHVDK